MNEVGDEITFLLEHAKSRKKTPACEMITKNVLSYISDHRICSSRRSVSSSPRSNTLSPLDEPGRLLYSQKIYTGADQMNYNNKIVSKLHRLVTFLVLFYVPAWLKCNIGADAAINDLNFLQSMLEYKPYDASVSTAAFQKLHKHNWYLTEENVIFSLCSQNIAISKESNKWQIVFS